MTTEVVGYRAWRMDQIALAPTFPAAWFRPAWDGAEELTAGHTLYAVLGAQRGFPVATVAYHGRTATWCCHCPVGVAGLRPCEHVRGVAYWVELDRLRRQYLEQPTLSLIEAWGREVKRVRAIRRGFGPEPPNWRLQSAALYDALCERGLAERAGADADPVYELIEQLEMVAA